MELVTWCEGGLVCGMEAKVHILMVHFTAPRFYGFENLQKSVEKRPCAFRPVS